MIPKKIMKEIENFAREKAKKCDYNHNMSHASKQPENLQKTSTHL